MKVTYEPGPEAGEGAKITIGLGAVDPDTLVLRQGEPPVEIPEKFEQACAAHPDVRVG